MIDSGVGETHINKILTALDIDPVAHKTLKKYERKVGLAIEELAEESCFEAISLKKQLTLENEPEQRM